MKNTDRIWDLVEERRATYRALADRVYETPEIAYTEYASCDAHEEQLRAAGSLE